MFCLVRLLGCFGHRPGRNIAPGRGPSTRQSSLLFRASPARLTVFLILAAAHGSPRHVAAWGLCLGVSGRPWPPCSNRSSPVTPGIGSPLRPCYPMWTCSQKKLKGTNKRVSNIWHSCRFLKTLPHAKAQRPTFHKALEAA